MQKCLPVEAGAALGLRLLGPGGGVAVGGRGGRGEPVHRRGVLLHDDARQTPSPALRAVALERGRRDDDLGHRPRGLDVDEVSLAELERGVDGTPRPV